MSDPAANLDLSVLPPAYRAAFEELRTLVARQEALIHELNHALYGKKSEKLTEDERQLAFEDLKVAVAEVEETREAVTATLEASRAPSANRSIGIWGTYRRACHGSRRSLSPTRWIAHVVAGRCTGSARTAASGSISSPRSSE